MKLSSKIYHVACQNLDCGDWIYDHDGDEDMCKEPGLVEIGVSNIKALALIDSEPLCSSSFWKKVTSLVSHAVIKPTQRALLVDYTDKNVHGQVYLPVQRRKCGFRYKSLRGGRVK